MTARMATPSAWRSSEEVGSLWGIVLVSRLAERLGRRVTRAFLWPVALYFFLTRPDRVEACRTFRARVGVSTAPWDIFLHFVTFAHAALDRLYFLLGKVEDFRIYRKGHEHVAALKEQRRGAMLLGCHLGSFEALRAVSRDFGLDLYIIADFHNAKRMNAILDLFGDNQRTRFLDAGGDRAMLALEVRDVIKRGGLVAILADRAGHGRAMDIDFLGAKAPFPVGPYVLAAHCHCPVYFTTSFATAPNRYEIVCEPLFDEVRLPRKGREEALAEYAAAYAERLEHYAKKRPNNWFNFYPFWSADVRS